MAVVKDQGRRCEPGSAPASPDQEKGSRGSGIFTDGTRLMTLHAPSRSAAWAKVNGTHTSRTAQIVPSQHAAATRSATGGSAGSTIAHLVLDSGSANVSALLLHAQ